MAPPAGCSVRVAVRVRPLLSFERTERLGECVTCIPHSTQLCVGTPGGADGKNTFTFDFTFPKNSEQRALYEDCVASLLEGKSCVLDCPSSSVAILFAVAASCYSCAFRPMFILVQLLALCDT